MANNEWVIILWKPLIPALAKYIYYTVISCRLLKCGSFINLETTVC